MKNKTRFNCALLTATTMFMLALAVPQKIAAWGAHGHTIAGRAAAQKLPKEMPSFFRNASEQLAYLNPEPDRWRDRVEAELDPAMNAAYAPDHFINFERVTEAALNAENRFLFLAEMRKAGMEIGSEAGTSPFHILEMFQRLRAEFRLWRSTTDKRERAWIEQRIINDAGLLGHYVTDGANPHHTTIHHHGWIGDNPKGYATDREFHARFESDFVGAQLKFADLLPQVAATPRLVVRPRQEVIEFLRQSHSKVEQLYQIDKRQAFNEATTAAENKGFAVERLAAGTAMLRDLWWTAWVTSNSNVQTK